MKKIKFIFLTIFLAASAFAQENIDPSRFTGTATIQVLNKTTAKSTIVNLKTNQKVAFGSLNIISHKCWQSAPDQKPESKILLEVLDNQNEDGGKVEKRIFYGWIFASSPSISGIEHPIYDIVALSCK